MSGSPKRDADAVRYLVLRKLASSFRHTMMGELQTIQFFAELSARLMQKGGDEAKLRECVEKIPAGHQRGGRQLPFGDRMAAAERRRRSRRSETRSASA